MLAQSFVRSLAKYTAPSFVCSFGAALLPCLEIRTYAANLGVPGRVTSFGTRKILRRIENTISVWFRVRPALILFPPKNIPGSPRTCLLTFARGALRRGQQIQMQPRIHQCRIDGV